MRNFYYILIYPLLLIIFFTSLSVFGQPAKPNINEDNIKSHIEILTSPEYSGRLIGTKGNDMTLEYLENYFKAIGLQSFNQGTYRKEFKSISFNWNGVPRFNVINSNGDVINSYKEGIDFIFRFDNMSLGGHFNGNINKVTTSKEIVESDGKFKDQAVIINYEEADIKKLRLNQEEIDDRLHYIGKTNLIIYQENNPMNIRNVNLGYKNTLLPNRGIIKIGVNKQTYDELIGWMNDGYKVDINMPISFTEETSSNIYGLIKGKNYPHGNYIMVATSIDGLGMNWNGEYYPGASDNAASAALMLELARIFSGNEEVRDSTIVFAGFNGKHTGSVGVQEYLRNPLFMPEKTEVIYLDKISGKEENTLKIGTYLNSRSKNLIAKKILSQFAYISNQENIAFELDDEYLLGEHFLFRKHGILASIHTYGHNKEINTVLDKSNNINISKIKDVGILINEYINFYGNDNLLLEIEHILKDTWWIIAIGIILVILKLYSSTNIKKNKFILWLHSKPIIFTYLLLSFFTLVLMIQTKHNISITTGVLLQDASISMKSFLNMFALNIFTTLPMIFYLVITLVSIVFIMVALYYFRKKIDDKTYLLVMSSATYIIFMLGFKYFYDYKYSVIYPKLLSFYKSEYIVVLLILLFSLVVTWILKKEIGKVNKLKSKIIFLTIFFILISFTYSPYVLSKEVITSKVTGNILKL